MSEQAKRRVLLLLIGAIVVGALGWTVAAASKIGGRDVVLVSRGMAFYLAGDDTPNPTLEVAPGETIRLTLINQDRGFLHDWRVAAWPRATTDLIPGDGSRDTIVFTAPDEAGEHEYVCSTHAQMMRGRLIVR